MLPNYLLGQPNHEFRLRACLNSAWYHRKFDRHYTAAHFLVGAVRRAVTLVDLEAPTFRLDFQEVAYAYHPA